MFNEKSSVTRVDSGKPTNIIENNKDDKISNEYVNKKDTWNNVNDINRKWQSHGSATGEDMNTKIKIDNYSR